MTKSIYFPISYFLAFAISLIVTVSDARAENESEVVTPRSVVHTISKGETLHMLAAYYLNDPRMWKKIYDENRKVIKKPSQLVVGSQITISISDSWRPVLPFEEFKKVAADKINDRKR